MECYINNVENTKRKHRCTKEDINEQIIIKIY